MLDIIKKRGYESRVVEDVIHNINPLNNRIHNIDDIFTMTHRRPINRDREYNKFGLIKYWYLILMKMDGASFIPGGYANQIFKNVDEFIEILVNCLNFNDLEGMRVKRMSLKSGQKIDFIRKESADQLLNPAINLDSPIPSRVDLLMEKKEIGRIPKLLKMVNQKAGIEKYLDRIDNIFVNLLVIFGLYIV